MIELDGVTKTFTVAKGSETRALDNVSFTVHRGETLCLIGGSGSGKTTALRLMNRLAEPTAGRVLVDGVDVTTQDPIRLRRSMGYVVQSGALLPHLTVYGNVGLLCKLEGWPLERISEKVYELLELVRMPPADYADRYPCELSGGQRQRVGVARALVLDPPIVLLDEPFGALDPITRRQLQEEFSELRKASDRTMVFVTHDLTEAFALADRVAILEEGKLLQLDTPSDLLRRPTNDHVAEFVSTHLHQGKA